MESLHNDEMMLPVGRRHNTGNLTAEIVLLLAAMGRRCVPHFIFLDHTSLLFNINVKKISLN